MNRQNELQLHLEHEILRQQELNRQMFQERLRPAQPQQRDSLLGNATFASFAAGLGANSLAANSLGANSLGANSLGANSLGASSLGANSLGASSLGANSLGANSLGANSLGANSLGANSFGANSLGANPRVNNTSSLVGSFSSQRRTPSLATMRDMELLQVLRPYPHRTTMHSFHAFIYTYLHSSPPPPPHPPG